MPTDARDEARALDKDELDLSNAARYPALGDLDDRDLTSVIARLRERRDRARQIAARQKREMRGKAAPSGTVSATGNLGTKSKHYYLNAALRRARDEQRRRKDG